MFLVSYSFRIISFVVFATLVVSCASNPSEKKSTIIYLNSSQVNEGEQLMKFSLSSDDQKVIDCVNVEIQKIKVAIEIQHETANGKLVNHTVRFSKIVTLPSPLIDQIFASLDSCIGNTNSQSKLNFELQKK